MNVSGSEIFDSDATIADGQCIFDVDYVGGVRDTDVDSYNGIKNVAEMLLLQCIFAAKRIPHGGSASGLGISWSPIHTERS